MLVRNPEKRTRGVPASAIRFCQGFSDDCRQLQFIPTH